MFLTLGIKGGFFSREEVLSSFKQFSNNIHTARSDYVELYMNFTYVGFGFRFLELLPTIQFLSSFLTIPYNYDLPAGNHNSMRGNEMQENYENFLTLQTHHSSALTYVKTRL